MDYSQGIRFETNLVNMDKSISLIKRNKPKNRIRSKKNGAGVAPSRTYKLPQGIEL